MIDLSDLEAKARAATQGECLNCGGMTFERVHVRQPDGRFAPGDAVRCVNCKTVFSDRIVAAQPSVVLGLIARVRELEAGAGEPVWSVDYTDGERKQPWHIGLWVDRKDAEAHASASPGSTITPLYAAPPSHAALHERVRELEEALRDAQKELFEAADKFNVIHHNHPGALADKGSASYMAEDKAFCAELSDRMIAAAVRARTALGGSNG